MKILTKTTAALLLTTASAAAAAQTGSSRRIPIRKDVPPASVASTSRGEVARPAVDTVVMTETIIEEWYAPTGTTCSSVDRSAARAVQIKTDLYNSATMISPDSAKLVALCAVPGQIGSGEMNAVNGRTEYAIDIIPNRKKTHTKVIVDAETGAVLSSKQFGGLRGLAGWVRESAEHRKNSP